jgi:hypothetical protein
VADEAVADEGLAALGGETHRCRERRERVPGDLGHAVPFHGLGVPAVEDLLVGGGTG